jgi:transposase
MLIDTLYEQWNGVDEIDRQVAQIERRLNEWMKNNEAVKAIH